ncbi:MAG: hypothetical protein B6I20_06825 [Bacteroidetes bacterium 4572_117]|nr:MAG: hypothetical protein B6I20_06825 [Bacteroidetes bacterium 4572_117]
MTQEISSKNTKAQIMDAYEELLKKVKNAKADVPKQVQEEKQRVEIVEKVADVSNKGIGKEINSLRVNLNSSLEELENNLLSEFKKLEEIRAAMHIEKQNLEDLYSLSTTTDSLAAMLLAQKERKENFEAEIKAKKDAFEIEMTSLQDQWKAEKEKENIEQKDLAAELKKNRKREEEEYQYKLKIDRQKEKDEYESQKAKLEKELSDKQLNFDQEMAKREADVAQAESELIELRKNNEEFPKKLEKSLSEKEREITTRLTVEFEFESKLLAKQNEGELKLKEQTIISLQEKISEMQLQIKELTQKTNLAESNVKDIAVKAIESSSKIQVFPTKEKKEEN